MALTTIQDEGFRRVLRFLGLRNFLPHDYESTVRPVISVGDLGQPRSAVPGVNGNVSGSLYDFPVPPKDESWRLIGFSGILTQTAGTIAPSFRFTIRDWGSVATVVMLVPFRVDNGLQPDIRFTHSSTLNTGIRFQAALHETVILGPGQHLALNTSAGDGTLAVSSVLMIVEKLGGVLSELD